MTTLAHIRAPIATDVKYIVKTWLRKMHAEQPLAFPNQQFYNDFQKVILELMKTSEARLASSPSDTNHILAFAIGRAFPDLKVLHLHFCYTRAEFRRMGLQWDLIKSLGWEPGMEIVATHWSKDLRPSLAEKVTYNYLTLYGVK